MAYATSNRLTVVGKPGVAVKLSGVLYEPYIYEWGKISYVGKKFTKLDPSSWAQAMTAINGTLGSTKACFNPIKAHWILP